MFEIRPYRKNESVRFYDPFREMEELERAFFGRPFMPAEHHAYRNPFRAMRTDIKDMGDAYLLEADLPGFEKKDIHLRLDGDILTVSAERKNEQKEENENDRYLHIERSYGSFSRSFDMSGVEVSGIKAKYENGVLALTLPKKQDEIPSATEIEIE